jgi:hypothetical protein
MDIKNILCLTPVEKNFSCGINYYIQERKRSVLHIGVALRAMQLAVSNVKRTFKRHQPSPAAPLKFALC